MPGKDKEDKINIVFAAKVYCLFFVTFTGFFHDRTTSNIFLCQTLCNAMGRESGSCNAKKECTCSEKFLTPEQFALCAAETSCLLNCKRKGYDQGKVRTHLSFV